MKKSIFKATAIVFCLSLLAKITGFVKSIIQASYFGATIETDAFNVAHGFVSNILYMLTTAMAVAFVPLYIQRKINQHDEKKYATKVITALSLIAVGISLILIIIAPGVVKVIAPTYSGEIFITTIKYFRIMSIGFLFSLIVSLYTHLLNAEKIYGFSTVCSIINSIVLIVAIVFFADSWGVLVLAISVPVAYFIQWIVLYIKGRKYGKLSFKYGLKDEGIKILALQALPILISQATVEINQVVDRTLLSTVEAGVVTAVSYAAVLFQFVIAIVNAPLSTVMFTELAEAGAKNDNEEISKILISCYKILFIVCIPIIIVMLFCSTDIVSIVYGHGNFDSKAISSCAIGLSMYGLCLLPACIKTVLSRAYYAINDTKRPMTLGILEVVLNIGLSIALVKPLGVYGVVGATAIASVVFIIIMLINFNRRHIKVLNKKNVKSYWKILVGVLGLTGTMLFLNKIYFWNVYLDFIIKTIIAFVIFGIILFIVKEPMFFAIIKKAKIYIKIKLDDLHIKKRIQ